MLRIFSKTTLPLTALLFAASCASQFNGQQHAMTVAEAHPIAVDSQAVTLTLDVDPATSELSGVDRARLRAFADAYLNNGHGPLTVTAPSGTPTDFEGQEAASDIRKALHAAGVPWSAINGATYRTGGSEDGDKLIVSFTRYVATASKCGVWKGIKGRDYRNLRSPNHGCATMNNIAAMVADPHDLIAPAASTPRDGAVAVRAIELYRRGEDTSSEVADIEPEISE